MKSMTGFGTAEYSDATQFISVEIKTVNHRYKDFSFKLSRKLSVYEDMARRIISSTISRGHVDISAKYTGYAPEEAGLKYDSRLAGAYYTILQKIAGEFSETNEKINTTDIAKFPGVITPEEAAEDSEALSEVFASLIERALDMVISSRSTEGAQLKNDFIERINHIETKVREIKELSAHIPAIYYESLMKNIKDYTGNLISEERLATEMAIYADRVNITEETVRLENHIANFKRTLEANEPVGRKLDFMLQEINREVNTIASKSNSYEISTLVVDVKAELEKIREQVQNIE